MPAGGAAATFRSAETVLLAGLLSPVAPVLPLNVALPAAVGVPETEHVTVLPAGTAFPATQELAAGLIVHASWLKPAGNPLTAQRVPAVASDVPMLLQVNVPL